MLQDLIGTLLIAGGVILFVWFLRGLMLTPVKKGKNTNVTVVVRVAGGEPCLEQTVKGLDWLRANGTLPGTILLLDEGMDLETARLAETLERSMAAVEYEREEVDAWAPRSERKNCRGGSTP